MDCTLDKDAILKKNPSIDKKLVEEALLLVKQAEKMGILPVGNQYIPPYKHTILDQIKKKQKALDKL